MSELSITPANVSLVDETPRLIVKQYGEDVDAGEFGYLGTDNKIWLAENDDVDLSAAVFVVALYPGLADEFHPLLIYGKYKCGATTVNREAYMLASTPGKCEPLDDLATSERMTFLFIGTGSDEVIFNPTFTGEVVT